MTLKDVQYLMKCGFSAEEIRGFMAEKPAPEKQEPEKQEPEKHYQAYQMLKKYFG